MDPSRVQPTRRTGQALREQYELEKKLAERLRTAPKEERSRLYRVVYDELFRMSADHPQLARRAEREQSRAGLSSQLSAVQRFLGPDSTFLEIGAGDCRLSLAVAGIARRVYAVEVSEELTGGLKWPTNLMLMHRDATSLDLPPGQIDFAYSNQVVEHLHPDDCFEQLVAVQNALRPGGRYLCITPNRLNGPWDVSRYFDSEATGLHLKEYTNSELAAEFKRAGFARVQVYVRARGLHLTLPLRSVTLLEAILGSLPQFLRKAIANWYPVRRFLGVSLVGTK